MSDRRSLIGIVLVSHSAKLAEGAAELAREMGGDEVRIEPAGGLDESGALGTDAIRVLGAIERAWSPDGVLVLMDLGSAVLSAETALDLLPEERRGGVLLCEAALVEGAVAAAVAAKIGAPLAEVAAEARRGLEPKVAHLGEGEAVAPSQEEPTGDWKTARLSVANAHGLHARPAARLVQTAARFDARVEVENATTGRGPVSARSLNAVATLGARRGHELVVRAQGADADRALTAVLELADDGFGEGAQVPAAPPSIKEPEPAAAPEPGSTLVGLPAAPGVAVGPARHARRPDLALPERIAEDPEDEWRALESAVAETTERIRSTRTSVAERAGEEEAEIFDAHLLFLEDEALLVPARRLVFEEGVTAATAWRTAVETSAREWEALDDEYLRARAADLLEVGRRVLAQLVGEPVSAQPVPPGILVAPDLAPGETAELDPELVRGIATAHGGPTSHGAILARALGVPAVVGLGESLLAVLEGTTVVVDGDVGRLQVDPPSEDVAALEERRRLRADSERAAWTAADEPAVTRDGRRIEVAANVSSPEDAVLAARAGADGIGLLRTEFLFLDRQTLPDEEEQAAVYREIASALEGRPVVLRTLDVGADKPLPSLPQPPEPNPFLGVRGIRLGLERPELLVTQLRAALRVAAEFPLKVMFPMVATADELERARELLEQARRGLHAGPLDVGVMVEVPSAALAAERLARNVDFFSIGTNDLSQYTMAADRDNARVARLADALEPAVLALVAMVVEAAARTDVHVAVCGEAAGDPLAVPLLVGLGVDQLSVAPRALPVVKQNVRGLDLGEARRLAEQALGLQSAAAVRALVASATTPPRKLEASARPQPAR